MKILVTGGAGFIGSHTVDLLLEKGFKVRIFDNIEPQVHGNEKPEYLHKDAELIVGSVNDKHQWFKALTGVDAVIHLAAMVGMGQSMYQPVRYLMANTVGTANMYEVILENPDLKKNIKKIVSASSKSIYGEGAYSCSEHGIIYPENRPLHQLEKKDWEVRCPSCGKHVTPIGITEEKPVQNLAAYALSKYDTERLTMMFGDVLKIPAIFLSRVKNNNPPTIYEDGNQARDFIYVNDIATANVLALEKENVTGVFNVGTGEKITIEQIARTIIDLNDKKIEPNITNEFRPGDNRHDFSDITKIKKELGFKPKWTVKQGMEKLIEWSTSQKAVDRFEQAEKERIKYLSG
jgi:dTDP-L-rhamnose 4-epimerase